MYEVLNFYKSYRAFVRGKIQGFQLNDPHIDPEKKNTIVTAAKKYFELSRYYAVLFSHEMHKTKPILFLVSGLSGTGKSTIAQKIAVDYHAVQINTDVVRKEAAGMNKFERHHDSVNTGLYDPKKVDDTYERVMQRASRVLKKGQNVVLDATFQKKKYRDMAHHIAGQQHAALVMIQCVCPDAVVKQRLEDRLKKKSVSDGRWEIYQAQKQSFEPFTSAESCLMMDTSDESYEYRMSFFGMLLSRLSEMV